MSLRPLLLLGAGGHALSCIDVIEREGKFSIIALVGLPAEAGKKVLGYPVIASGSGLSSLRSSADHALVTVGQILTPKVRKQLFADAVRAGFAMATVVSPTAIVSAHARIGEGTIVMHGAVVNAGAGIGRNCIVNSRALIEHGAHVGDHTHISTGAIVNGDARVGADSFVGSGAIIRNGISVGERCIVGMGELVLRDSPDDSHFHGKEARS